jgi:predicted YcjX-like family ATPase
VRDLQRGLNDVLAAFRTGDNTWFNTLFRPRIDKILIAATKADHLHHLSHDRLEAILRLLATRSIARAEDFGAEVDVIALAAVRATREASIKYGKEMLDAIVGTPLAGECLDGHKFDGSTEAAVFPGQLPEDARQAFRGDTLATPEHMADVRFLRFRPPQTPQGAPPQQIRLDRACQFLFGDWMP